MHRSQYIPGGFACGYEILTSENVTLLFMPQPHLDSFNFMLGEGIQEAVRLLPRIEVPSVLLNRQTKVSGVTTPERAKTLSIWIEDVKFGWPLRNGSGSDDVRYPGGMITVLAMTQTVRL